MNVIGKTMNKVDEKLKVENMKAVEVILDENFGNPDYYYKVFDDVEKVMYFSNELNFFISNVNINEVYELKSLIESIYYFCTNGFYIQNYIKEVLRKDDTKLFDETNIYFTNDFITCKRATAYNFCLTLRYHKVTVMKVDDILNIPEFIAYLSRNNEGILDGDFIIYPTRVFTSKYFILHHQDEYFYPIFAMINANDKKYLLDDMDILVIKNPGRSDDANI